MESISMMSDGLLAFAKKYNIAINDPDLKRMYRMEMFAKPEEATRLQAETERAEKRGERRGEKRGEKRGEERGFAITAQKMKQKGYLVADIVEITGLSPSQIAAL